MDEDVASGRGAVFASGHLLRRSGIRNVEGFVELALRVARIQDIDTFRRFVVSLLGFGADWGAAEGYFVFFDDLSVVHELEDVLVLED